MRISLLVFNFIFLLCGLGIIGIGIWIRIDMMQFDALLGHSIVPIAAYVLIAAGGVVLLISLAGCIGAWTRNKSLLALYFTFMLLIFLAESATAVLASLFYDQVKPFMSEYVETGMMKNYGDPNFELITKSVDIIQQKFKCCGFEKPEDWNNATAFVVAAVPVSCCRDQNLPSCNSNYNTTNIYDEGCVQALADWMNGNLIYLMAVAIAVALFQLIGMVFSVCLCKHARDDTIA